MIPGELRLAGGDIELNAGRATAQLDVTNVGDRPIQVGSHYPFFETNRALKFDRETPPLECASTFPPEPPFDSSRAKKSR